MRANTYEHLEGLCRSKGIVCERYGKKIELVTPCGGTTALVSCVKDALNTLRTDEAFSSLPIKLGQRDAAFADIIRKSDRRLAQAKEALSESARGRLTMRDLKTFFAGAASGLDNIGQSALLVLVEEFVKNQRRGFLDGV